MKSISLKRKKEIMCPAGHLCVNILPWSGLFKIVDETFYQFPLKNFGK